jgi:hypothetical protein
MMVYRITRCAIPLLDKTWYKIDRFGLFEYVREAGLIKTFKQLRSGVLSFNPYKLRKSIERLKKLDRWFYKEMMMSMLNIK